MKRPEPSLLANREAPIWRRERKRYLLQAHPDHKVPTLYTIPSTHPYTLSSGTPASLGLLHHSCLACLGGELRDAGAG